MQLTDLIKVYPQVLSKQTCDRIIQEFETKTSECIEYKTDTYQFTQLYFNASGLGDLANAVIAQITPYVHEYFNSVGLHDFVQIRAFEDVRIKRYYKNIDEFKPHVDVTCKDTSIRYLACLLYLNDNNGNTEFPSLNRSIKPETGSLLIFPPLWMYPHVGRMPTDYDKYLMMTFLNYT